MEKKELEQIIRSTLNIETINPTIKKQITRFILERGLSYDDIAHALTFYIEVEQNKYEPKYGIAFVDWTVDRSRAYYAALEAKKKEQIKSIENKEEVKVIKITKIKKRKPIDSIDITKLGDD